MSGQGSSGMVGSSWDRGGDSRLITALARAGQSWSRRLKGNKRTGAAGPIPFFQPLDPTMAKFTKTLSTLNTQQLCLRLGSFLCDTEFGASSSSKMLQSSRHTYTTVTQGRSRASHGRNVDRWRRFLTRSRASSPRARYLSRRPTCQIRTARAATHCATSRSLMPPLFSESLHLVHNFEPVTAAHCIGLSRMPCHLPAEPIIPLCRRSTVAGIVGLVETARILLLRNNVVVV
ncbi:hypothetical protein B0H13DRAFT_1850882 [Mycena leptocephala]|nr:hypothetical protein B0H13DRAFT_1850882 [Mycena leptocephala]